LFDDGRSDEDQIGVSYDDIEWAMNYCEKFNIERLSDIAAINDFTNEEAHIIRKYLERHDANRHKMQLPPVCDLSYLKKD
jgi:NAD+ synthase